MSVLLHDDPVAKGGLVEEWGRWLSSDWDWDWWVTLTYDTPEGRKSPKWERAKGSATHTGAGWSRSDRDWARWLDEVTNRAAIGDALSPPFWFRGREPNPWRYGTHFHALVGGVAGTSRRDAWASWFDRHGFARIEPYDPRKGAGWYVSKYVAKELGDLRFSDNAGLHRKDRTSDDERTNERLRGLVPDGWIPRGRSGPNVD